MRILIAGGTGFIGTYLTSFLLNKGYHVFILTRHEKSSSKNNLEYINWNYLNSSSIDQLETVDVIINLAGESINGRWTQRKKQEILTSRMRSTQAIYSFIRERKTRPSLLINASAIGIYGTSLESTFNEESPIIGSDFLARTVNDWEKEASKIKELNVRTVYARFGLVLGKQGALPKLTLPYRLFLGGNLGNGQQWISWIHIDDLVRILDYIINTPTISGPINVTAPTPVTMEEFGKAISNVLHSPHWLKTPTFVLRTLLGEMSILVVEGQKVIPEKLNNQNFDYKYPLLHEALKNLFVK